jgi:hypothetical protein
MGKGMAVLKQSVRRMPGTPGPIVNGPSLGEGE